MSRNFRRANAVSAQIWRRLLTEHEPPASDKYINQSQWCQKLPAKKHELVVAEPGQGPPHPDEEKGEGGHLEGEPDDGRQQRPVPAPQEEGGGQPPQDDDVDVLADEEKAEAHPRILAVEA